MATKRKCYQCDDEGRTLDEIREARNEEIRAWGRKVLADADAALKGETAIVTAQSDWEALDAQPETPEQETVEVEVDAKPHDVLAATEPQETEEIQAKVDASPKPAEQGNVAEHQNVEAATEETPAEAEESLKEDAEARNEEEDAAPAPEAKPAAKKAPAKAKSAPSKD